MKASPRTIRVAPEYDYHQHYYDETDFAHRENDIESISTIELPEVPEKSNQASESNIYAAPAVESFSCKQCLLDNLCGLLIILWFGYGKKLKSQGVKNLQG